MRKNIIAIICGVLAAAVIVTGSVIGFGKMNESESIGASSALSIALNDAGVARDEAKNAKSVFEKENGRYIFDVEFEAKGYEYDYDIDASTGEIVKREAEKLKSTQPEEKTTKKKKDKSDGKEEAQSTTVSDSEAATNNIEPATQQKKEESTSKFIGLEAAKQIALKKAGVSAGSVRFTKAKQDYENGVAVYEIEFIKGNTEYEFEIGARDGKILDFDTERLTSSGGKRDSDDDDDIEEAEDDDDDEDEDDD